MMKRLQGKQQGASVIGLVITLFVIGYAAYVGIQWVPQLIEAQTVGSILDSIQKDHRAAPVQNEAEIKDNWSKLLNINEMNDMKDVIEIDRYRGQYTIKVAYERQLDLLYQTRTIQYEKAITLD